MGGDRDVEPEEALSPGTDPSTVRKGRGGDNQNRSAGCEGRGQAGGQAVIEERQQRPRVRRADVVEAFRGARQQKRHAVGTSALP